MNRTTGLSAHRRGKGLPPLILLSSLVLATAAVPAAAAPEDPEPEPAHSDPMAVLTPMEWIKVEDAVDRALACIVGRQEPDGRFPTTDAGQPAVTSLCVLALLARGHLPGEGRYGDAMDAAVRYVISCQKPENGLIANISPGPSMQLHGPAHTGMYNHAISGVMLSELYGMTDRTRANNIRIVVERAVNFTRLRQLADKQDREDRGAWRYLRPWPRRDSDLSVTGWQMMFYRSAANAGFDVPSQFVDEGLAFIERCFDHSWNAFVYSLSFEGRYPTRGMVGSGVFSLSLAGKHDTEMARAGAAYILRTGFDLYNRRPIDPRTGQEETSRDRYHYGAFYCTQAMFQLGGENWEKFYPRLVSTLLANQDPDGSWQPESGEDYRYGDTYTTALVVLVLTTPNQLLPTFQR